MRLCTAAGADLAFLLVRAQLREAPAQGETAARECTSAPEGTQLGLAGEASWRQGEQQVACAAAGVEGPEAEGRGAVAAERIGSECAAAVVMGGNAQRRHAGRELRAEQAERAVQQCLKGECAAPLQLAAALQRTALDAGAVKHAAQESALGPDPGGLHPAAPCETPRSRAALLQLSEFGSHAEWESGAELRQLRAELEDQELTIRTCRASLRRLRAELGLYKSAMQDAIAPLYRTAELIRQLKKRCSAAVACGVFRQRQRGGRRCGPT
eukprot:TRINITY_DN29158_c0_g2_i2.p3 TRINITY_DN29158_c0_g2~~TRINITY_DN29158_c0_g2_i2.p3  ORF type:complete len:269 (+),score=64.13 TRINITY_DN29158_c0_g2_i2:308-1114(+)